MVARKPTSVICLNPDFIRIGCSQSVCIGYLPLLRCPLYDQPVSSESPIQVADSLDSKPFGGADECRGDSSYCGFAASRSVAVARTEVV